MRLARTPALVLSHWVATYAMLAAFHFGIEPLKTYHHWAEALIDWGLLTPLIGTWILLFSSLARLTSAPLGTVLIWGSYLSVFFGSYHLLGPTRVPRPPSGRCAKCGYDLRATPDRCPECGTVRDDALEKVLLK